MASNQAFYCVEFVICFWFYSVFKPCVHEHDWSLVHVLNM